MKKIKYIIIGLIILVAILIVILVNLKPKIQNPNYTESTGPQDNKIKLESNTTKEKNDNIFFSIADIVQSAIKKEKPNAMYYAQAIYTMQDYNYATYYTYGFVQDKSKLKDAYLKVRVDMINNTFVTEKLTIEEYNKAKMGEITQSEQTKIPSNGNNQYEIKSPTSRGIAQRYIADYILKLNNRPDMAFELLEENYKNKNFKTIEEFKQYIQKNKERFDNIQIETAKCEVKEDSLEYTILDEKGNYYKIIVYNALNYNIVLEQEV